MAFLSIRFFGKAVDGEVKGFADEEEGAGLEALLGLKNGGDGVLELIVLHQENLERKTVYKKPADLSMSGLEKFCYIGSSMKPSSFLIRVGWRIFRRAFASI